MSDNNKYYTMPFSFDSPSPLSVGSDGLKIDPRDWFAGQALAGLLACDETGGRKERFAKVAYEYADAMLAERQKERE